MDQQFLNDVVQGVSGLPKGVLSGGSFLLGSVVGYRFSLAQDRRREFNIAAEPIREFLLKNIAAPAYWGAEPTLLELDRFEHCLPRWRRKGFRRCWDQQQVERHAEWRQDPDTGVMTLSDAQRVVRACERTLEFTTWR